MTKEELNKIDEEIKKEFWYINNTGELTIRDENGDKVDVYDKLKNFLHSKLTEAYEKGKEEERKTMYSDECLIIKKETRQETLEEVEKKIEEIPVFDIADRVLKDRFLQTIKEMKKTQHITNLYGNKILGEFKHLCVQCCRQGYKDDSCLDKKCGTIKEMKENQTIDNSLNENLDKIIEWARENTGGGGDTPYPELIEFIESLKK